MPVRVVTDSTSDIPPRMAGELDIIIVPLNVHFGNQVYRDGVDLSAEEFYRRLAAGSILPTTSQPSAGVFTEVYRRLLDSGCEIVSIHISAKLSGTMNSAAAARESLGANSTIIILDSLQASMGLGLIVLAAARAAQEGATLDGVAATARDAISRANTVVMVDTLEYLHKGGRIGKAQAFLGGLLKVKPIIRVHDGEAYPLERPRTRARALERLLRWVGGLSPTALAVMHSTTSDEAASFAQGLDRFFPRERIHIGRFGPVMGTYLGPGALGVTVLEGQAQHGTAAKDTEARTS